MAQHRLRLVARIVLVAIVIVHLRLDVLAQSVIAASVASPAAGARGSTPPCCCCSPADDDADPEAKRGPEHHDGPLHDSGCPLCPKGGCNDCCIFCIYAKAPCGPAACVVSMPAPAVVIGRVVERHDRLPAAPIDEFFQPPRV